MTTSTPQHSSDAEGAPGAPSEVMLSGAEPRRSPVAVEMRAITKRFGAVAACDRVDLDLRRGAIHGLLGENGAGKSTLMKLLIGLVLPDEGTIAIDGEPCQIVDPIDAARRGIGMVHQHYSLVDSLTVWENVALGDVGRLDPRAVRDRVADLSRHYGLAIEPDARVGELPAGLRQRVEIIKCLRRDPSIVIFDEPTSVLTPEESEQLFDALRRVVQEEGRAVALVSHKLDEVLRATDEITIMRQGRVVDRVTTTDATAATLARAMVGRDVALRSVGASGTDANATGTPTTESRSISSPVAERPMAAPTLRIRGAVVARRDGRRELDGLDLEVYAGEIVGVAGVEGNGQRALGDLLSSLERLRTGVVEVDAVEVATGRAGAMADAGVAVIPEDRHDSGVVLEMTVAENLFLVEIERAHTWGVVHRRSIEQRAQRLIAQYEIQCDGPAAPMWSLSGGNQQRVVLARELAHNPRVLVAAQPTRGLDVGAIEYISTQLRAAAASGVAVLLISSDLDEILELSDRIVVMSRGRIIGEMTRAEATRERIGPLLGGEMVTT